MRGFRGFEGRGCRGRVSGFGVIGWFRVISSCFGGSEGFWWVGGERVGKSLE